MCGVYSSVSPLCETPMIVILVDKARYSRPTRTWNGNDYAPYSRKAIGNSLAYGPRSRNHKLYAADKRAISRESEVSFRSQRMNNPSRRTCLADDGPFLCILSMRYSFKPNVCMSNLDLLFLFVSANHDQFSRSLAWAVSPPDCSYHRYVLPCGVHYIFMSVLTQSVFINHSAGSILSIIGAC